MISSLLGVLRRFFPPRAQDPDVSLPAHQETLARADRLLRLVSGYNESESIRPKRLRRKIH